MDLGLKKVILVYEKDGKEIPIEIKDEDLALLIKLFNMTTYYLMTHSTQFYIEAINRINRIIKEKIQARDKK